MKKILPVLLCYVLSASQVLALSGGPVFTTGAVNPTGRYSGVIEGLTETNDITGSAPAIPGDTVGSTTTANTSASNALGLFDLTVPNAGNATGTFILFQDGRIFTGTIMASADPDNDKLMGILEATYNFTLDTFDVTGAAVSSAVTATAVGQINAKITPEVLTSQGLGRLTGTANLEVSFGEVDSNLAPVIDRTSTFNVIGFKQSSTTSGTT